ncbi:MOSC and FAD-binding oxidoreductase domain-containing protein [Mesorhizobium sp. INR15]|uniref:MOSC and FAD-binding oxidoreductase domain-containing protein n=1 Tax=Mesorhizobium sp. INR15 TaxID=2654248 RepID=UPI0018966063|nr:MOSC and FAD-binding oxidoreductase domain-containing protein [Mesorhizobium sp. INR15]QPC89714.1 MOSC domain-containing protein [Mesorhizobium sp. INR15]
MARLLSVNVGLPREISWQGKTVGTAIWKAPVQGPRQVRRLNVDGDGQGDLEGHGGEHRAVLVYQTDSYRFWRDELRRTDLVYGQFGENFTVEGLPDREVCIGDRYRIGSALFEVTQPRVTCYRVGIRMNEPQMAALLVARGRPGFYLRVLEEGQVEAGDGISQVGAGPERMTVCEINSLLYLPGRSRVEVERALRIPALSSGWRESFQALLAQKEHGGTTGTVLAPAGFLRLRVSQKIRESSNVMSLVLEPVDGSRLAAALPGQFVVVRLQLVPGAPTLMRSYSLSGEPSERGYRISVKRGPHGVMGAYIHENVRIGDVLDVSSPRGNFTLRPNNGPVVLVSAGVGITPVLAMLHALAAEASQREIWWIHGARDGKEHPFAQETQRLLNGLPHSHRHIRYSAPAPEERLGIDFDARGRVNLALLGELVVPRNGDFYICGPSAFMSDMTAGLAAQGIAAGNIHAEFFGPGSSKTPGIASSSHTTPHLPPGPPGAGPVVSFARSGLSVNWGSTYHSLLELAEACDIPTRWSCRTGVCHACETGIVAGTVAYRPDPIDPAPVGKALICCSHPQADLVLDL